MIKTRNKCVSSFVFSFSFFSSFYEEGGTYIIILYNLHNSLFIVIIEDNAN